uniref:Uncharacterized protein n=1 Tax=Photinus pyralis TaxID=7054 RepID=A0A1Y1KC49_PHOPY
MGVPIAAGGRMGKRMAMVCAPDLRDKERIPAPGITASKFLGFILGQVGALSKVNGKMVKDMVWAWRLEDAGYIGENGLRDLKDDTASGSPTHQRRNTRARGPTAFRMVTVPKRTPMTERIKDNGCVECVTGMESETALHLVKRQNIEIKP